MVRGNSRLDKFRYDRFSFGYERVSILSEPKAVLYLRVSKIYAHLLPYLSGLQLYTRENTDDI